MRHVKLFENFQNNIDPKLVRALKTIVFAYKDEVLGSTYHLSEVFGEGVILKRYAKLTDDTRIKFILKEVAASCQAECDGSAENIVEIIGDGDCNYIANFLGLEPLDYESSWTREEEQTWTW